MAEVGDCSMHEPGDEHHHEGKPKGILKHSHDPPPKVEVKWDEMNILETYHPANKDYGHMKINEPPTPYSKMEGLSDDEDSSLNPEILSDKIIKVGPRIDADESEIMDSEGDEDLPPDELERKREFKKKRAKHYDEFSKVKLARELIAKELSELEDDDDTSKSMEVGTATT